MTHLHQCPSRQKLPLEVLEDVVASIGVDIVVPIVQHWPSDAESMNICWSPTDRMTTLHSCALVCRDWVPRSRICLYKDVKLDNERRATSFMATITASPQFGTYVNSLELDAKRVHTDWIYKVHLTLPPLLPNLVLLQYRDLPIVHPLFFVLSARFNYVAHLGLADLKFWTFREIVRLLDRFTQLKSLQVDGCIWESPSSFYCRQREKTTLSPTVISLKLPPHPNPSLPFGPYSSCHNLCNVASWLTKRRPSYSLTKFSFQPYNNIPERFRDLQDLLVHYSKVLEELELAIKTHDYHLGTIEPFDVETETCQ